MKRIITRILVVVLLVSLLAGCSDNKKFDSTEAMLQHLEGMYVGEAKSGDMYCWVIFEGKLYFVNDAVFEYCVESVFSNLAEERKFAELSSLEYSTVLEKLGAKALLPYAEEAVICNPKKGTIIIDEGQSYEKKILVKDDGIVVKDKYIYEDVEYKLAKNADTVDFSDECFVDLFEQTKKNYEISLGQYWTDAKDFGEFVRTNNPVVNSWNVDTDDGDLLIYKPDEKAPIGGSFMIAKDQVLFSKEDLAVATDKWKPDFTIYYSLGNTLGNSDNGLLQISDVDNLSLNVPLMFQYAVYATKNFPGTYTDYMELYNAVIAEESTVENGWEIFDKMICGVHYQLKIGTNGTQALLVVNPNDTISLRAVT